MAAERDRLTPTQRAVLHQIAYGESYKRIAALRGISARTVEIHAAEIRRRLGAENNPHAIYLAMRSRILTPWQTESVQ